MTDHTANDHRNDWAWLVGSWNVRHRRLKERLTGSTDAELDTWKTAGAIFQA